MADDMTFHRQLDRWVVKMTGDLDRIARDRSEDDSFLNLADPVDRERLAWSLVRRYGWRAPRRSYLARLRGLEP